MSGYPIDAAGVPTPIRYLHTNKARHDGGNDAEVSRIDFAPQSFPV